jgi:hypothetical protein
MKVADIGFALPALVGIAVIVMVPAIGFGSSV